MARKIDPQFGPLHAMPNKALLTPFWSVKHSTKTVAVPSAQGRTVRDLGPYGPRPGARRGGALCTEADGQRTGGRTVRDLVQG
jgi:hypothetical protein